MLRQKPLLFFLRLICVGRVFVLFWGVVLLLKRMVELISVRGFWFWREGGILGGGGIGGVVEKC